MGTATIYVELLDEGVPVWRPAEAENLGGDWHRLLAPEGYDAELETWAFTPGTVVRCELRRLSDGSALVAVENRP